MIGKTVDRLDALFDRRFAQLPGWVAVVEVFLGVGWGRAAIAKIINSQWWAGHQITDFIIKHDTLTVDWYRPVLDLVVFDQAVAWAGVVLALQLFASVTLLAHRRVGLGVAAACFLNVNFLLGGAANPSAFYIIMQLALGIWLLETTVQPRQSIRALRVIAILSTVLAAACVPFIETLHPDKVINDPALVLSACALCAGIASSAARRRVRRTSLAQTPPVIDLRIAEPSRT